MASTYSSNLKIELMGTGDQVGSWGTTTNNNFQYALEEAVVGYGSVQFTNDANLTISLANSNASQTARKFFLYVTSTVTLTQQRDLIVPTIEKTYTVHNNTTGGQAIRVKTAAGTGIVVPSGKKMLLYVNGTNVIEQIDYITSLEIGSLSAPLAIASGGTGASTDSGARTNLGLGTIATQAANNVSITGGSVTGVTLASASASFTGTPTAPTAAPGTNTTQIATTAFVQNVAGGLGTMSTQDANNVNITGGSISGVTIAAAVLASLYPVGSIYMNATNATNPGTLLGFGTWTAFGAGRVPVGFNAADPLFDTAEETGGSKDSVVVSHTHTGSTSSAGAHQHYVAGGTYSGSNAGALESNANNTLKTGDNLGGNMNQYNLQSTTSAATLGLSSSAGAHTHSLSIDSTGSSGTNANLQPYITVYMWKRTA